MARLNKASRSFEKHPRVKAGDILGLPVTIVAMRGPYTTAEFPNRPFCVATLEGATPEASIELASLPDVNGETTVDLILGWQEQGQRADLVNWFKKNPDEPVEFVALNRLKMTGGKADMWLFEDISDDNTPDENGYDLDPNEVPF